MRVCVKHSFRFFQYICTIAFTLLSIHHAVANTTQNNIAQKWQSAPFIQQAFNEIALRSEYSTKNQPIRKWNKPIKVWLDHKVAESEKHQRLVKMHLKHLSAITKHPISLVKHQENANVKLVLTTQKNWPQDVAKLTGRSAVQQLRSAVCMAGFQLNKASEISSAWVVIPVDQAEMHRKLVACIVEELTQIMGLPNDSDKVYPSIFNDKTPQSLLTGLDSILLKLLYLPNVKSGMTEAQVDPIIRKVIKDWQQDGTIRDAVKNVRKGELYELLGY